MTDSGAHTRLKRTGVVAGATLASRVLGFVRDMVIAAVLGTGPWADAFFVAFRIPEAFRRLLGEGTVSMAVTPGLAEARARAGVDAMFRLGRSCMAWAVGILAPLVLLGMLFSEELVNVLAPGFAEAPALRQQTATLLAIMLPYGLTAALAGLCMGMLHVQGRFLAPALSPCLLNSIVIAAAAVGGLLGLEAATSLAVGLLVAGAGQLLLQQPALRGEGFRWRGPVTMTSSALRRVAVATPPTILGASAYQLMLLLASFWGTTLGAGMVSALYFADRLLQFPVGLAGVAVSTVAMPELAAMHARGAHGAFREAVQASCRLSLSVAIPAAVGLWVLAEAVVTVLFGRGAFDFASIQRTTAMLESLALALPGLTLARPLLAATFAKGGHRVAVRAGAMGLVAFVATGGLLHAVIDAAALPWAILVGVWTQVTLLWRGVGLSEKALLAGRWLWRVLGCSVAMGVGILVLSLTLAPPAWLLVCSIPLWMVVFAGLAMAVRLPEAVQIVEALKRRMP